MTETNKLRVSILEDNELLRSNLVHYLMLSGKYIPAFASGLPEELMNATEANPDFILLDIHLKGCNGIDLIPRLKVRFPETHIVIITGDNSEELVLQAFKKGAKGYLYKPFSMETLLHALKSTGEQGYYLTPATITNLLHQIKKEESVPNLQETYHLTEKETQIVELVKEGLTYTEIATKLYISYHTVNHHLKNIYIKTNVRSKSELLSKLLFKVNNTDNEPQKNPSGR